MKIIISLFCLLFLTNLAFSQSSISEQEMKMRMLMNKNKMLATIQEREQSSRSEETQKKEAEEKERDRRSHEYGKAYDKAWEGYKPLVIWVNMVDLEVESRFTNAVHLHVSSYKEVVDRGIVVGTRSEGKFLRYDFSDVGSLQSFLLSMQSSFRALPSEQIYTNLQPQINLQHQINPLPSPIFSDIMYNARPQGFSIPGLSAPSTGFTPSFMPQSSGGGFSSRGSRNC